MRIVELGDNSMVIMKDSEDPPWVSVGDVYRRATNHGVIVVESFLGDNPDFNANGQASYDYIYSAGRLILFFKDSIEPQFHLHDRVYLRVFHKKE